MTGEQDTNGGRHRTLIVLRHCKAAHIPGLADRERPLTGRGERDAKRVGETLRALALRPDLVLCSPSVRTRRTAELALVELAPDAPVEFPRGIYEAYADELLDLIRATDPGVRTLMLVGHNPGVHELVMGLTTRDGDPGFPPGAFAVIEADGAWSMLDSGHATTRWNPKTEVR
ncbi:phosphohistidine phosphatase [Thermocatellispora tengchongensis]|uniref:Phosphohistidine phosphatase n=1 Tax=Thermocatellispora tengchongensis TaxID=1073253 RepID=A0A840PF96_9ACTN|nr:histidine phosphatase family protein [Thermocatellispora tengchongensis]MBB5137659.1 phosphohistidine phosphatase [Thermocatellispora tengchongensis]